MGQMSRESCIGSIEMKRHNPNTKTPFRRGDVRHDGYVFFAYTNKRKADGHFVEIWLSPQASDKATANDRARKRLKARGNRRQDAAANA
jgi:hypothetical protein